MKAQFKYTFRAELYLRGIVFAVISVMMLVFAVLGSLGFLPEAAQITAVSLAGIGIAVMFGANIASDVAMSKRLCATPDAYLHALTPAPRRKFLLASVLTMMILDIVTMAAVITGEVVLSFNLANVGNLWREFGYAVRDYAAEILYGVLFLMACYLLAAMIILFCVTAKKSIFYKMPASWLMTFLLACGCVYAVSLLPLIIAPFGTIERYRIFITITLDGWTGAWLYLLLTFLEAAGLFVLTSKLMERKMNL
ncbi:MAG: hypothetical protein LBH95_01120 [Oscillospiraceae bacterium]|jgi:hypothetical protein|nr:hypothetical protein [Oscillospiraceae bacterium]